MGVVMGGCDGSGDGSSGGDEFLGSLGNDIM